MPADEGTVLPPSTQSNRSADIGFSLTGAGLTLAMKKYVASNREDVGVLGPHRIVQRAQPIADLIE